MLSEKEIQLRVNKFASGKDCRNFENYNLYFDAFSVNGLNEVHRYSVNPKLYEFFEYEPFQKLSDTENFINKKLNQMDSGNDHYWFARRKSDDYLIGTACLVNFNYQRQSVEWGYGIDPDFWGTGFIFQMQEILKFLVFDLLELNRLGGLTSAKNSRTIASVKASGMVHEGTLKDYMKIGDVYHDGWQYGMTASMHKVHSEDSKSQFDDIFSEDLIIGLLSEVFPDDQITNYSSMQNTVGWDSLGHMRVIMSLKEKFGLKLSPSEIAKAYSVKSIVEIISSRKDFKADN